MPGAPFAETTSVAPDDPLEGNDTYIYRRHVGKGAFGSVVEALDRITNERVAIKLLPRGLAVDNDHVRREILNHHSLCHYHVIRFHRLVLTPHYLGIVMEFAQGGNLMQYLRRRGPLSMNLTRFLFQQLVLAVEYCHQMNVCNRDIKLQNTLIVNDNSDWPMLKVCDFGYSKHEVCDTCPNSVVGTLQTMPPEVATLRPGQTYNGVKADIWSVGVFLYMLVANRYPFVTNGEAMSVLIQRLDHVQYEIPGRVPKDCADLIRRILVRDPRERPTIEEIKAHPWFEENLPEGAEQMNNCLRRQRSVQTLEQMMSILEQAKRRIL